MARGFSLAELLVTLVAMGLILAIAVPKVAPWMDRAAVQRAARVIAGAQSRARLEAAARGTVIIAGIARDSVWLADRRGSRLWKAAGPAADQVMLAPVSHLVTYAPSGMALGFSNATLLLSRGTARAQVVISRLGRVRILP